MKYKLKFILEIVIFVLIFMLVFDKLTLLLVKKGNGFGTDVLDFYKRKENSIDVLFLGSSHAYTSFNPDIIKEKTNLESYIFATQQQPIWITYYYLEEALKYQNPKYVVLEVHMLTAFNYEYTEESITRDAIDKMKFSLNKINANKASLEKKDRIKYYFNIVKYHSRYKQLIKDDFNIAFRGYTINNKGYKALLYKKNVFDVNKIEYSNHKIGLSDKNKEYLNKIINLCKKNNIKLMFVKTPAIYNKYSCARLNSVDKIADDNDILFINYIKDINKLNFNYDIDFFDSGHLSWLGSNKLTLDFIKYLK